MEHLNKAIETLVGLAMLTIGIICIVGILETVFDLIKKIF
jgi:hypothetical protein